MGDRGNVRLIETAGSVWFYTHWQGSDLPEIVQKALTAGKSRWDDPPYLNRIIFDGLTEDARHSETGFGISASIGDNQHPIVVVDHVRKAVSFTPDGDLGAGAQRWPFDVYAALSVDSLRETFAAVRVERGG